VDLLPRLQPLATDDALPQGLQVWHCAIDAAVPEPPLFEHLDAATSSTLRAISHPTVLRRALWSAAMVRVLLGAMLDKPPPSLRFRRGSEGKPELDLGEGGNGLCFNVSHSREQVAIVVARDLEVGVDIEWMRPGREFDRLAVRVFSERERVDYSSQSDERRPEAFYRLWCAKEAVSKAWGLGMTVDPREYDVVERRPGRLELADVRSTRVPPGEWRVGSLRAPEGYAAAVAFAARGC
jgi:4'-phosphopantetheinyl transferase